jgi:peptide/nickel transport system substrate-binding protein
VGEVQTPPARNEGAMLAKRGAPGSPTAGFRPAPAGSFSLLPVLCLFAVAACGGRGGPVWPQGNELTVALPSAPIHLDPRVGSDAATDEAHGLLFDGLLETDPRGELVGDLAERWETLDGGRLLRFHLREGVRFHDGRPFGAEDVVWTLSSIVDGTVATAKRAAFDPIESVAAVATDTVDIRLREPNASFPVELTIGVVPAGALPDEVDRRPVGTGPFRFVGRSPERVRLAAFEAHWAGRPHLDRLTLKEVPDGTVRTLELMDGAVQLVVDDLPPDVVPRFRQDPAYQVVEAPSGDYAYLGFNLRDPVLADRRVRRAIAHALDRQRLVDTLWRGLGIVGETMLPPGHWARDEALPAIRHDPEAARRLLDEAGHPDPDGAGPRPRLALELKTSTTEIYFLQAQVIQAMLAEVGIELTVRSLEFATFYADVQRGDFQTFTLVRSGIVDPNIYRLTLHSASTPPAGHNRGFYANPRFDRLIDRANRATDRGERRALYVAAQRLLARDLPYVSLFVKESVAVMPAELRGFTPRIHRKLGSLQDVRWERPPLG